MPEQDKTDSLGPCLSLRHIDCPGHCGCFDSETSIDGSAGSKDAAIDHLMVKLMNASVNGAGTISWKQSNTASNTQITFSIYTYIQSWPKLLEH